MTTSCSKVPPCTSLHAHNVYMAQKEISHEKEICNHIRTQHPTGENGVFARASNLVRLS